MHKRNGYDVFIKRLSGQKIKGRLERKDDSKIIGWYAESGMGQDTAKIGAIHLFVPVKCELAKCLQILG